MFRKVRQASRLPRRSREATRLLLHRPLGRGRTVLIATDGSLSSVDAASGEPWTTWPTWPSFLPLVRELLAYAMSGQHIVGNSSSVAAYGNNRRRHVTGASTAAN